MQTCIPCRSPERLSVDLALLSGEPVRSVGAQFGLQKSSVHRHALGGHVSDIARVEHGAQELLRSSAIEAHLASLWHKVSALVDRLENSEEHEDLRVFLAAVKESRSLLELLLRYVPEPKVVQVERSIDLYSEEMLALRDVLTRHAYDRESVMATVALERAIDAAYAGDPVKAEEGLRHNLTWNMNEAARKVPWPNPELQRWWEYD